MNEPIRIGIASAVLEQELDAGRFEDFCCALVSCVEGGRQILPTSKSWDRGRDGRSVGPGQLVFLCATLDPDLDTKSAKDIQKIVASGAHPDRLYYCTSRRASEHRLDEINATLAAILGPEVSIQTLSGPQLARFARQFSNLLWQYYPAEIRDCVAALQEGDSNDIRDATVLALSTACHDTAAAVRDAAYNILLLRILSDGLPRTTNECSRDLSNLLKLSISLAKIPVEHHLDQLLKSGHVSYGDGKYTNTPSGEVELDKEDAVAAAELLHGRAVLRETLEDSLGTPLLDDQYARIWNAVQTRLTRFFYEHGHQMVLAVQRFVTPKSGKAGPVESTELPFFVQGLADAAAATSAQADFGAEIRRAVVDIFEERHGPAYQWLTRICSVYVVVCMLGLEATSGARVEDTISSTHLVLDTDIVLELLGDGEPGHESAVQLVDGWKRIGGTVLFATPVAEELAYHASISSVDYTEARGKFLATETDRRRYVRNVFVRSFGFLVEQGQIRPHDWERYIRAFRGADDTDIVNIASYLRENFGLQRLPDGDLNLRPGKQVREFLLDAVERGGFHGRDLKIRRDKASRDARLFASMSQYASALNSADGRSTCILVTSSGRLRDVSARFGSDADISLSLAEAVYLLTMVPGATIGLSSLGSVLFDSRLLPRTGNFDLMVLRAIRDSAEYSFPWARRSAVTGGVRRRLLRIAKDRQDARFEPEEAMASDDEEVRTSLTAAIGESLKGAGADPKLERELSEARARVKELERQLKEERRRGK